MPIYEYKCNSCGHEYELIQKMSDAPIIECEKCHKNSAQRLVSAPGFQLKGTGWYETDFKNKGKPNIAKNEKSGEADTVKTDAKQASSKDGGE